MTTAELTTEQHATANALRAFGPGQFVRKVGGRWVVEVEGFATPTMFATRRAAMAHAQARVMALLGR